MVPSLAVNHQFPSIFSSLHSFGNHQFPSIAVIPTSSADSATDPKTSEIAESHVLTKEPAPLLPVHTVTFHRINLLSPFRRIARRDISAPRREAAAMEQQDINGELDVRNAPLPLDLYLTRVRFA